MRNPYTCDNCIYNPSQYLDIGSRMGYCLKHGLLLKNSSHTTCHFFKRKDLPLFLSQEGHKEHANDYPESEGIIFYYSRHPEQERNYSERHVWLTNTFDPYLHEVSIYHRSEKKWVYLQAFLSSRNPIKHIISSSLIRRYMQQCGKKTDNYRLVLSMTNDLKERISMEMEDFRVEMTYEEFDELKENYLKDIVLLKIYGIQEYGSIIEDDKIMWISDELNGALLYSWREFFSYVRQMVPLVQNYVINGAKRRGTFFPDSEGTI